MRSRHTLYKHFAGMRVGRFNRPTARTRFVGWLGGFAGLADGLVTVLSLGYLKSNFEFQIVAYNSISHHLREKQKKQGGGTND